MQGCCPRIASSARIAARSAAKSIPASPPCAPRFRVNLKGHFPGFKIWSRAQADIDRVWAIWRDCLDKSGGPFLFGETRTMADAMYAPVVTRFVTYNVKLEPQLQAYADTIMAMPEMKEWIAAARDEPAEIEELEVEY
ncbi:glutathione S-transferase [Bradyrhizobium sp. F1.13.1]